MKGKDERKKRKKKEKTIEETIEKRQEKEKLETFSRNGIIIGRATIATIDKDWWPKTAKSGFVDRIETFRTLLLSVNFHANTRHSKLFLTLKREAVRQKQKTRI